MNCPKCKEAMTPVMEEAMATWWRCPDCTYEVIRPPEKHDYHFSRISFPEHRVLHDGS